MAEIEVNTVTIPIDEYFDLRTRAEQNIYLSNKLGCLEENINEIRRRLWELECKVKGE